MLIVALLFTQYWDMEFEALLKPHSHSKAFRNGPERVRLETRRGRIVVAELLTHHIGNALSNWELAMTTRALHFSFNYMNVLNDRPKLLQERVVLLRVSGQRFRDCDVQLSFERSAHK